jgi:hypothetical protein
MVHEYFGTIVHQDESITFGIRKPLHMTFDHLPLLVMINSKIEALRYHIVLLLQEWDGVCG